MMRTFWMAALAALVMATSAPAVVVLNELFINPPGSLDATREYIELLGTPGKQLDGYAIALVNGSQNKYWPVGTPYPADQEIDEFFSLDGLALGDNGLLVLAIQSSGNYSTLLSDTAFAGPWFENPAWWNGGYDVPGKMQNDGANTILLVRNRPGRTQADPTNPLGLRWGKDVRADGEYVHYVEDPQAAPGTYWDQWGNGNLDKGEFYGVCVNGANNGLACVDSSECPDGVCVSGTTLDLKGASTPGANPPEILDDLEVVDEVSYEHDRGWEYDLDDRHVDEGSSHDGLPYRHVHALDDPQGFNPDVLTRVDYRTKGAGWTPAPDATGELPSGNNWQDTATEQWIRGEATYTTSGGQGASPFFYFDNADNDNADAIQPYVTNVPLWLDDGQGADYDFTSLNTYQIMAGRVNPLAVAFIPGDCDRDGDCDLEDINKLRAVFGDADWLFSNSYQDAPEGDDGDPATQTRPWDVDATGSDGIEAADLQWTLNFQGDTTGHVVGVRYDSDTPAATGVHLNSNAGVVCTVSITGTSASGRPIDSLLVGDVVTVTVWAEVTGGANLQPGQHNGIMQFGHDLILSNPAVATAQSVAAVGPFALTRSSLHTVTPAGATSVAGYTTSFEQGLSGAAPLWQLTLTASNPGTCMVAAPPLAGPAGLAASLPDGLTVGHTQAGGKPAAVAYTPPLTLKVLHASGDANGDQAVDIDDYVFLPLCLGGPNELPPFPTCLNYYDFDGDLDVDLEDVAAFSRVITAGR